jgi:hypothetical protein
MMNDEEDVMEDEGPGAEPPARQIPPASEKQHKFIQGLKKQVQLTDDELATLVKEVTNGTLDELDVKQASEVIDELKITGREQGIDFDAQPKASDKQIGFIKSLKRKALLTDAEFETLLQQKAGVPTPEDLGKRDASAVIDELIKLKDSGGNKGGKASAAPTQPKVVDDGDYGDVPF